MGKKYDFWTWYNMYHMKKKHMPKEYKDWDYLRVYEDIMKWCAKRGDVMSAMTCSAEAEWFRHGTPYYKVWPQMAEALGSTSINISGKYLNLPFPTYEIRFPKTDCLRESPDTPPITAMLVHRETFFTEATQNGLIKSNRKKDEHYDWSLMVHYQLDPVTWNCFEKDFMGYYYRMGIDNEKSIEEQFEESFQWTSHYLDGEWAPSKEFAKKLVTIAIGVAFFGLHQHEMVMPDIPNKFITRYHTAVKEKNDSESKRLLDKAKRLGHFGWKVGSEIDLPRPIVEHETVGEGSPKKKWELTYGHIRSGHMRMQPYGPKDNPSHYELKFIPPTPVRPDLPIRETRGFRLKDNILNR